MRILLDTNVLLRLSEPSHPLHKTVAEATIALRSQNHELLIVPQSIYEFWTVATRSIEANGLEKPPAEVHGLIGDICGMFRLLRDERSIYEAWLELVSRHNVRGVRSFDTRLAAAMFRHRITHLLTTNAADFRRYEQVDILEPEHVVDGTL